VWFLQKWTDIAAVVVTQGHVFVLYQLLFGVEFSENVRLDLLRYRPRVRLFFRSEQRTYMDCGDMLL
jgi:hypothetical protein